MFVDKGWWTAETLMTAWQSGFFHRMVTMVNRRLIRKKNHYYDRVPLEKNQSPEIWLAVGKTEQKNTQDVFYVIRKEKI